MTDLSYLPIPTGQARAYQNGGKDAHGNIPKKFVCEEDGLPCRHCLKNIEKGEEFLILSHRPFESAQPFAEQGPIFLCADAEKCSAYPATDKLPDMYEPDGDILLRGYDKHNWIVYGTGQVVKNRDVADTAKAILATDRVRYIHARSATNNCFQFRIEAAG